MHLESDALDLYAWLSTYQSISFWKELVSLLLNVLALHNSKIPMSICVASNKPPLCTSIEKSLLRDLSGFQIFRITTFWEYSTTVSRKN